MKKLIGIIITITIAFSMFCPVTKADANAMYSGTVYYFDAVNGNNSNDGISEDTAFKSLTKVAVLNLQPGDAVLLKRGDVFTSAMTINNSGTAENPITFSYYGDENKALPLIKRSFPSPAITIKNQDYVIIDSLHIMMTSTAVNSYSALKVEASDGKICYGNSIRNCIIEGISDEWKSYENSGLCGISVEPLNYWGFFNGVTIENNEIYNCKANGISVNGCHGGCDADGNVNEKSAKNVVVRNNFLYNIGKDGIVVNNCNQPLVEYNTCGKAHSYADKTWHVAMWPFACYKSLFQYNEAYETQTVYDGQGFDCDYLCYYTTFQYNYSHNNTGGFMLICTEPQASWLKDPTAYNVGSVVRYNISQNDCYRIFTFAHHITDTSIYNNTIYSEANADYVIFTTAHNDQTKNPINTKIFNNIFYTADGGFKWLNSIGTEFKNNIVYGENAALYPQNDSETTADDNIASSGNIYADPMLIKAGGADNGRDSCLVYKLKTGSPAIGAGLVVNDTTNVLDFFGNKVFADTAPNIGAYNGEGIEMKNGDINYDNELNMNDLLIIKKYLAKIYNKSDFGYDSADMNSDGKVDAKDVLILKKQILNK